MLRAADRLIPELDAIDIDADARLVQLVYRAKTTYDLVQFELRRAALLPSDTFPELKS